MNVELYTPSKEEAAGLLLNPGRFRGWVVLEDSLPPRFLLERAIGREGDDWLMPRLFIDSGAGEIVGSACFKTEPKNGKVEIGYGISLQRRRRGFATCGVILLVEAVFTSSPVEVVLAATVEGNFGSRRVLEKAGFVRDGSGIDDEEGPVELWTRTKRPNGGVAAV